MYVSVFLLGLGSRASGGSSKSEGVLESLECLVSYTEDCVALGRYLPLLGLSFSMYDREGLNLGLGVSVSRRGHPLCVLPLPLGKGQVGFCFME